MQRLVLIDGHAIAYRAYHALPPLTSRGGQLVNAVYGFTSMLLKVIADLKPTHIAVAFDLPVPTFRHEAYIAYQAKRPAMDREMSDQLEWVREVVEAAGIPIYTSPGFEADDVIGTLALQAVQTQKSKVKIDEVVIVTGDRDMMQLVGRKVKVYAPIKGLSEARLFDSKGVKEYIGVAPSQIVDYKALMGDSADNYPGVPGIGPKTAVALIEQFGSLENLYKKMENGKWKMENVSLATAEKLKEGHDAAMLSQKLARIVADAPVKLDLEHAKLTKPEGNEKLIEKLREFGFRSLIKRVGGEDGGERKSSKGRSASGRKKGSGQMNLV
ncbi:MAG: 5'-3' exonuclease H3TH domain-containing protein [bacterium]|nr:5'-3' exonuclease H3TH domain-containing protein [bacterium]